MATEVSPVLAVRVGFSSAEANRQAPLPLPTPEPPEPQTRAAPDQREDLLTEARLSTRLRIEIDELANRYVLKRFVEPDPDPVAQYPSESHLRFARAITAALRAAQAARLDIKA